MSIIKARIAMIEACAVSVPKERIAFPEEPPAFLMTDAMREPHTSRKKPGDSVPNAASDIAEADTINRAPNQRAVLPIPAIPKKCRPRWM